MQGRFEHDQKHSFGRDRSGAVAPARRSPATERNLNGGADDRTDGSHLALIERVALAAFPNDAEVRKRILDAARERMAHHRRRGARFDRAKVGERKGSAREAPVAGKQRTKEIASAERQHGDR